MSAKEKGAPGRKELLRSPSNFPEGCSRICWRAVTGERDARSRFLFIRSDLLLLDCVVVVVVGFGAGAGGGGVLLDDV